MPNLKKIRVSTMGMEAIGLISTLHGWLHYNTVTYILGVTMILVGIITQAYYTRCPHCNKYLKSIFIKAKECPHCHEQLNK